MRKIYFFIVVVFFMSGCSFYQNLYPDFTPSHVNKERKLKFIAKEWKNTPYVLGGRSKKGTDCSAFTQNVMAEFKIHIPRTTQTQLALGTKVSKSKLKAGDLVFFKTNRGPNGMHVGIYTNKGKFIHLSTKGGVKEARLDSSYWKSRYIGARRY
ncbi:NlpC/P60 family protein [Campylobacter hepaticus]|uniref:C40 family peptidase n=1 Tax=Campylobacter hepaticus TaxID=1813019 RepID=UPI00128CC661|nr:C40 family peptidase [Campylobacter hepaticus]MPV54341.1 NlpC/P60 family protein [Campylobacter hepaticus]